jgi:2-octaprenyl-6-methoxyphenol hydroxylase
MRVCILGAGLSSLTLAQALVNENIFVDLFTQKKKNSSPKIKNTWYF